MPTYNKLIRDKIPQIIDAEGKTYTVRTLSDEEYVVELKTKLGEELKEYLSAADDTNAVEELADLLELVHTLTTVHGFSPHELEEIRCKKADKRGGFREKLFLLEVQD
jgi:predicted house-cleaning noncanonical NTP pyrophosphatase (MazG superfamily)